MARFASAASQWGHGSSANLSYEDLQGPGCVRIIEDFPLDVFTVLNGKSYEFFIEDAATFSLAGGLEVRCLSVAALIDLKKGTQREKDQLDVTVLQRLRDQPPSGNPPVINLDLPPAEG